jgi:hypothetical protein
VRSPFASKLRSGSTRSMPNLVTDQEEVGQEHAVEQHLHSNHAHEPIAREKHHQHHADAGHRDLQDGEYADVMPMTAAMIGFTSTAPPDISVTVRNASTTLKIKMPTTPPTDVDRANPSPGNARRPCGAPRGAGAAERCRTGTPTRCVCRRSGRARRSKPRPMCDALAGDQSSGVGGSDVISLHYPEMDGPSASPIRHNPGAGVHIFFD